MVINPLFKLCARMWHQAEPDVTFDHVILDCIMYGAVHISPNKIVIAKPAFYNGTIHFNYTGTNNCLFIYAAAGDDAGVSALMDLTPQVYKWLAFKRRNKYKVYNWERFRAIANRG